MGKVVKAIRELPGGKTVNKSAKTTSHKVSRLKFFLLSALIILILFISIEFSTFNNPELVKNFVLKFGLMAPVVLILLQTFQSMISIIPSQITTIAAGYVFGPIFGLIYSLIGSFIGSSIVFLISRKYGAQLAMKFFPEKDIIHFQVFFRQKKSKALFLARIAPIFPNDLISFAAGLTKINYWKFSLISSLGFLIQIIILSFFGSGLAEGQISMPLIVVSIVVGLLFLIVIFKKKIRKIIIRDIKEVEKELRKGVKIVF